MNEVLESRFVENVKRLALGLELIDAGREGRTPFPVRVIFDETARGLERPPVDRHDSCLHALIYQPGVADQVTLRFFESERRFVPRRINYPILTQEQAESLTYQNRVRRPFLFPGAAYGVTSGSTAIRGRVERGGEPVRWARVEATPQGGGPVVGRAHGDDRGEFLLVLEPAASPGAELVNPLPIQVDVFGPATAPVPEFPELPGLDPWWDLPLEQALALNPADPETDLISAGEVLPDGYTATAGRVVNVPLGRVQSERNAFEIP